MYKAAISLLEKLIATPSMSRNEDATADIIYQWLDQRGVEVHRVYNNLWAKTRHYDTALPTLLLNSHHDTVRPAPSYSFDPYKPFYSDGKLYGLGSNDAGAALVSLLTTFVHFYDARMPFNLLLGISAEEEVSGEKGMRALLPELNRMNLLPDMGIVGEPTSMQPAIAERGLMVLDCVAHGKSGHAARNEGVNALYKAIDDINRIRNYKFEKVSSTLGDIKTTVTIIEAGHQHNVVPDECKFVVDVRTTDAYSNEETEAIIAHLVEADVRARSYRIRASVIGNDHPLVQSALGLGLTPYVSPTTSDMALMAFPTLKIGPGESSRSHTADEYIYEDEICQGIDTYLKLLTNIKIR